MLQASGAVEESLVKMVSLKGAGHNDLLGPPHFEAVDKAVAKFLELLNANKADRV